MSALPAPVRLPDWVDPSAVFAAVADGGEHVFWLDAGPGADRGWSWVGTGTVEEHPERVRGTDCSSHAPLAEGGRFRGGWVGWLGYEDAAARAGAPRAASDTTVPSERWLRVDHLIAFDHAAREVWVFSPDQGAFVPPDREAAPPDRVEAAEPVPVRARHEPGEYAALVERCRDAIREGDAYQLCLTTRFETPVAVDPVAAFGRLRSSTPAHHGGLIVSGVHALASASPERFLEVADGLVRT
ncbi:MAG: chorismate-binding protein, partial [Microbacterium sp.]